jgi:hypothetical protein
MKNLLLRYKFRIYLKFMLKMLRAGTAQKMAGSATLISKMYLYTICHPLLVETRLANIFLFCTEMFINSPYNNVPLSRSPIKRIRSRAVLPRGFGSDELGFAANKM